MNRWLCSRNDCTENAESAYLASEHEAHNPGHWVTWFTYDLDEHRWVNFE